MKTTNPFSIAAAVVMISFLVGITAQADDMTIDDFETYSKGQIIGKSWDSTPWRRFGNATNDNVVATGTDGKVVSGARSAQYGAFWPNRFGAIRFVFKETTDLNPYSDASIKIRSDNTSTSTSVKVAVSNGETTYIGAAGQSITNKIQHIVFSLDPSNMILADGSDSFADVITNAKMIGLDCTSSDGRYTESIIFDDFELRGSVNAEW